MSPPRIPEKAVQASIVKLLRSIGATVYVLGGNRPKGDHPGTRQTPGIPDLYVHIPYVGSDASEHFWVEVKAKGGKLRPEQAAFMVLCHDAGMRHIVGGLDEVLAFLRAGGWVK